jgi:hypothetical protein
LGAGTTADRRRQPGLAAASVPAALRSPDPYGNSTVQRMSDGCAKHLSGHGANP